MGNSVALKRGWGQPFGDELYFSRYFHNKGAYSASLQVKESKPYPGLFSWLVNPDGESLVQQDFSCGDLVKSPEEAMDKADKYYRSEVKRIKSELLDNE